MEKENPYIHLWEQLKRYFSLNVENVKLSTAEKLAVVLSAMVLILAGVLLGVTLLFFITLGVVQFIAPAVGMGWAYMIMAGLVALLVLLLFIFRKALVIDPVARFISRVILK